MSVELNYFEYAPVLFATKAPSMKCVFRSLRFHLCENEKKAFSYRLHTQCFTLKRSKTMKTTGIAYVLMRTNS